MCSRRLHHGCCNGVSGLTQVSRDVFSMPTQVFEERSVLESKLASSWAGRFEADAESLSEPIAMYNLFKTFSFLKGKKHAKFYDLNALHAARFREFRTLVGSIAKRCVLY